MKRLIKSYQRQKLEPFDRNILRGIFRRDLKDFNEEFGEKMTQMTLKERMSQYD